VHGRVAQWEQPDLRVIETYRELFPETIVGYSGHDNGIAMPVAAYVLGGRIVEKHFTLNRLLKGSDLSLDPVGLRRLVRDLRGARVALGDGTKTPYSSEAEPINKMGKKIVAATTLPVGHVLRERIWR
jgi:sialic acid synthase